MKKRFEEFQKELKPCIEGTRFQMIRNRGKEILFGNKDKLTRLSMVIPVMSTAVSEAVDKYPVKYDLFLVDGSVEHMGIKYQEYDGAYGLNNADKYVDAETSGDSRSSTVTIIPEYKKGQLVSLEIISESVDVVTKISGKNQKCEKYRYKQRMTTDVNSGNPLVRVDAIFAQSKIPPIILCSATFNPVTGDEVDPASIYFWEDEDRYFMNSYKHEFEITRELIDKSTTTNLNLEKISSSVDSIINSSSVEQEMVTFTEDGFLKEYYRPSDTLAARYIPVPNVYYDKSFDIVYTMDNGVGEPVEIDRVKYRSNKNFEYCVGKFFGSARKLNEDGTIKRFAHFRPFEVIEVEVVDGENGKDQRPYIYSNAVLGLAEFEKEEWVIITTMDQNYIGKSTDEEDANLTRTIKYDLTLDVPTERGNFVRVSDSTFNRTVEMYIGKLTYIDIHSKMDMTGITTFITPGIQFTESVMPSTDGLQTVKYVDNDFSAEFRNNRIVSFEGKLYLDKPSYVYSRDYFGIPCTKHIWFDTEPDQDK